MDAERMYLPFFYPSTVFEKTNIIVQVVKRLDSSLNYW